MTAEYPIDAMARGKVRAWKRNAAAKWDAFNRVMQSAELRAAGIEFAQRGSAKGQSRALGRMQKLLTGTAASLEGVRYRPSPTLVWAVLKPRESVVLPDAGVDLAKLQDCVAVNYFVVYPMSGKLYSGDGLWTLEVPDHALGRLLQRDPAADLDAVLMAAHHAALRAKVDDVHPALRDAARSFLLPAGNGVLTCSIRIGPDVSMGNRTMVHLAAHTWLHRDQLHDDQTPLLVDGVAGDRLGEAILLPAPLKRFIPNEDGRGVTVITWAPGLPETLAQTRGMA